MSQRRGSGSGLPVASRQIFGSFVSFGQRVKQRRAEPLCKANTAASRSAHQKMRESGAVLAGISRKLGEHRQDTISRIFAQFLKSWECSDPREMVRGRLKGEAQRLFDGISSVAERAVGMDLNVWPLLKGADERDDLVDLLISHLAALLPQRPSHGRPALPCIDQLHQAAPAGFLVVADQPDVRGDFSVVKQALRQSNDRLEQVSLEQPSPYGALAACLLAGEQRGPVADKGDAPTALFHRTHVRQEVLKEEHLAVAHARDTSHEAPC